MGEANFILNWGSSPLVRLTVPDEFRNPYRDCWTLCEWVAPEEFGDPDGWDERILGPYPSRGAYNPVQVFRDEGNPVQLDSEFLNLRVLEMCIWVILNHKHDSLSKRVQFLKDDAAERKAARTREMIDRIEECAPSYLDGVSFSGQLNCNSVVRQKMEQLEKNLPLITERAAQFRTRGILQSGTAKPFHVNAEV